MLYSVVVPVYNSASTLDELYNRLKYVFGNVVCEDFELLLINDASKDDSLSVLKRLANLDNRVKYIHLAKNHGQQKAVLCGIEHSCGDYVITMDDDLQHPPEEIPKLISKIKETPEVDVVIGMYDSKKHSGVRCLGTKMLDALSCMAFSKTKELKLTSFRLMKSFVADNLTDVNLKKPTVGHCLLMVADNITNVEVRHDFRKTGESGYSFLKLVNVFMDNVYTNSDFPLRVVGHIGTISFIISILMSFFYFVRYLSGAIAVSGWTTIVIVVLFMNGLSLLSVGIIGRYLIVNINETKRLPKYSIKEKNVKKKRGIA